MSSERPKLLEVDASPRALEFVASAQAERLVTVGAPCPDHLVHTKRVPLWIPFDPDADDAGALRARIRERAAAFREDYRAYVDAYGDETTEPADPDPRIVLVQHVGLVATGTTAKQARVARDLYHRAIEVMAGAEALGRVRLARRRGELRDRVLAARALQARAGAAARRAAGRASRSSPAARAASAARSATRCAPRARASSRSTSTARAPRRRSPATATRGSRSAATSRARTSVAAAFAAAVERFGGVDIVVSNAGVASSAALEDTSLAEWRRNHEILVTGYFLVAREAFRVLKQQDRGGAIVFIASKNALVAGRNAAAYSSAKAAELHLARCLAEEGGADGIRVNTVNPDAVLQGSRIWDSSWREERAAAYGIEPDELEEHYRKRTTLRRQHLARRTSPRRCCTSPRRRARARAPATCSTSTGACPRPTPADPAPGA